MAPLLTVSAQAAFECAYTNYTLLSGLVAGEFIGAQTFLSQVPYQRRDVRPLDAAYATSSCESSTGLHTPVSIARFVADDAIERIGGFSDAEAPDRNALLARNALYAGYSYVIFGEGWCSAAFDLGPELAPAEVLQRAVDRFSMAIELASQPGGDAGIRNAAYVGRARAKLSLGETATAAEDARIVPEGFVLWVTRSAAADVRVNKVFTRNHPELAVSVDPAFWGVEWMGVPDPRVTVTDDGILGQDGLTPMWRQQKYTSEGSPIRLASYVEAQLIVAEIEGGQVAVDVINELHEVAGLPAFESDDPEEIRKHVIEERRRELFLEGHRMGDLRRLGQITEVTSGRHPFVGDAYGGMECFPLPNTERQGNPNIP